jgi:hypothetical protein
VFSVKKNPAAKLFPGCAFDVFRVSDDESVIRSYYGEGSAYTPTKVCASLTFW